LHRDKKLSINSFYPYASTCLTHPCATAQQPSPDSSTCFTKPCAILRLALSTTQLSNRGDLFQYSLLTTHYSTWEFSFAFFRRQRFGKFSLDIVFL